jgi:TonB family protein
MKTCQICRREYADDLSFCLDDGSPLSLSQPVKPTEMVTEEYGGQTQESAHTPAAETVAYAPARPEPAHRSKIGIYIFAALLLAGIVVVIGASVAGFWWYKTKRSELSVKSDANVNVSNLNQNINRPFSNSNVTHPIDPTPSPSNSSPITNATNSKANSLLPKNAKIQSIDEPPPAPLPSPDRGDKTPAVPKTISGGVLNGKAVNLPRPPYPPAAKAVRASGAVNVQVTIDERGNVISASAVSGHPLLQAAAVAAARGAKFTPTLLAGQPVKVTGVIVYNFVPAN